MSSNTNDIVENSALVVASAAFILMCELDNQNKRKKRQRRFWIKDDLNRNRRKYCPSISTTSTNNTALIPPNLPLSPIEENYNNFIRMSSQDFEFLVNLIGPKIQKADTKFRKAVTVKQRIGVTLCFLATGHSYTSLQYRFKISKQLISQIIPEVCEAINEVLVDYIKMPTFSEEWLSVSEQYEKKWNFPHCLGAVGLRRIKLQTPIHNGNEYNNHKPRLQLVLFAIVDADYNFLFVDMTCDNNTTEDIFGESQLNKTLDENRLDLPKPSALMGRKLEIPYFFVANNEFPLKKNIMKPYTKAEANADGIKKLFNQRLNMTHSVVDNVFDVVSSVFGIINMPILLELQKTQLVILTVVYLHNFLRCSQTSRNIYTPVGTFDNEIDEQLNECSGRNFKVEEDRDTSIFFSKSLLNAKEIRSELAACFSASTSDSL